MKPIWTKRIAATLIMMSFALVASAQYVWLDEKGSKQYSDMPPPASIPQKNILKQPGRGYVSSPPPSESTDNSAKDAATDDKAKAPMTTAEKNADFQKRKAKQAEDEAKAAAEAKHAAAKAKACENARNYSQSLSSGQRIATTDKSGERSFLTDEQRAKELREAREVLNECK